jgi:prepilin-type N-terminal cleavage/methylation domain-containing protein
MIRRWQEFNPQRKQEGEQGFTLIELLIVIIILGVLSAIVVFAVTGIASNGTKEACASTVKTVNTAAEAYFAQFNAGTPDLTTLKTKGFLHDAPASTTQYTGGAAPNNWTVTFALPSSTNPAGNATGTYGAGATAC